MRTFSESLCLAFAREIWRSFNRSWDAMSPLFAFGGGDLERFAATPDIRPPRESTFETLQKLKDDPNIYISYIGNIQDPHANLKKKPNVREYPRVGVNPKSHYNTPLGIYTYPLHEIWGRIEERGNLSDVPYQGEKPYIAVLRLKDDKKFINDMYNDYDSSDFDEDKKKLRKYFVPDVLSHEEFEKIANKALGGASEKNPIMSMWNLVRHLSYIVVQMKKKDANKENIISRVEDTSDLNDIMPDKEKGRLNPYGLAFNRILNGVLKYDGFADKSGKGYIHSSEPTQAVFLDPRSYQVLGIYHNENSDQSSYASKRYKNRERLQNYLLKNLDKLSTKQWQQILSAYPEFWNSAPDDEEIFKNPYVVEAGERYWDKEINDGNLSYVSPPKNINYLPKMKAKLEDLWIKLIETEPDEFEKAPDYIKSEHGMEEKVKGSWKKYIFNHPGSWSRCPYKDVKDDSEVKDIVLKHYANELNGYPHLYDDLPEELKKEHSLFQIAIKSSIDQIIDDPRSWNGLNKDIQSNEQVIAAAKSSWVAVLKQRPVLMDSAPEEFAKDPEVLKTAKEVSLEMIRDYNAVDVFSLYTKRIPNLLMQQDGEIRNKVIEKWAEYLQGEGITLNTRRIPTIILEDDRIKSIAIPKWKEFLSKNPEHFGDIPDIYSELKEDPEVWKQILLNPTYSGEYYRKCPVKEVREMPEVQAIAREWWKDRLTYDQRLFVDLPPEFADLKNDPDIKEKYYTWFKNQVFKNPTSFEPKTFTNQEEIDAYMAGIREYLQHRPVYYHHINENYLKKALEDPETDNLVRDYFRKRAISYAYEKIDNPYGDDLYKDPVVIQGIKDYGYRQYFKGYQNISLAIPELAETIKNDPNIDALKMQHYKDLILKDPSNAPDYAQNFFDDAKEKDELLQYAAGIYKGFILSNRLFEYTIPTEIMSIIEKDEGLRKPLKDMWLDIIYKKNISQKYQLTGYRTNYNEPPQFILDDPDIQHAMNVVEWVRYLNQFPQNYNQVPPQYASDPKVAEKIAYIKNVEYIKEIEKQKKLEQQKANEGAMAQQQAVPTQPQPAQPQPAQPQNPQKPQKTQKPKNTWNNYLYLLPKEKKGWESDKWYAQFQKGKKPQQNNPKAPKQVYQESDERTVWASAFNDNVIIKF